MKSVQASRIGITLGDPAGIGPEVALKAITENNFQDITPILIGSSALIETNYKTLLQGKRVVTLNKKDLSSLTSYSADSIYIYSIDAGFKIPEPGKGSQETGAESLCYIDASIELWKEKLIDAVVTGPVSKAFVQQSGTPFRGHTEYYAEHTGGETPYMMLYSEQYSVILVTTHLPIHKLHTAVTEKNIASTIKMAHNALAAIKQRKPRIAIVGFDPHCGDDGAINDFDSTVTARLVSKAQDEGIDITGPFAADTLFIPSNWASFDIAIAMYHDQGLIPFKMVAFDNGVNVTLGLPIVRTSVDHGTAFNIAGKNKASHSSMVAAIKLAHKLTRQRQNS